MSGQVDTAKLREFLDSIFLVGENRKRLLAALDELDAARAELHCFYEGEQDAAYDAKQQLDAARLKIERLRDAAAMALDKLNDYFTDGIEHDDSAMEQDDGPMWHGCPRDDTCGCDSVRLVREAISALEGIAAKSGGRTVNERVCEHGLTSDLPCEECNSAEIDGLYAEIRGLKSELAAAKDWRIAWEKRLDVAYADNDYLRAKLADAERNWESYQKMALDEAECARRLQVKLADAERERDEWMDTAKRFARLMPRAMIVVNAARACSTWWEQNGDRLEFKWPEERAVADAVAEFEAGE